MWLKCCYNINIGVLRCDCVQAPAVSGVARSRKAGFSMVEVLVSIVVLAIGVIGAAGMHLTALRTAQQAAFQTFALHLVSEMADAIRASEVAMARNGEANPFLGVSYDAAVNGAPTAPGRFCYANACDAGEFAEFEIYEWKRRVKAALPGGRLLICRDAAPWSSASKALTWDCSNSAASDVPFVIKLGWQAKNPDGSLIRNADNRYPPSVALTVSSGS